MTTTVAQLLKDSYSLANVIDDEEELSPNLSSLGMRVLNSNLAQWSSLQMYISAYTLIPLSTVANVYSYTINPTITEIFEASYYDSNNIKYNLRIEDLKTQNTLNYQLSAQQPTRPNLIFLQNDQSTIATKTSKLFLFPVPDQVYSVTIYAKQVLLSLNYSDTITTIPEFEFEVLTYQLAKLLSIRFQTVLGQDFKDEYNRLIKEFKAANQHDYSVRNSNPFNSWRRFRPWSADYGY